MNNIYDTKHKIAMELLKARRLELNLTQKELAEKLECVQSYVSKYESGQVRLDIIELRNICEKLGYTLEEYVRLLELKVKE